MIDALLRALAPRVAETPEPLPPGVSVRRAGWLPYGAALPPPR